MFKKSQAAIYYLKCMPYSGQSARLTLNSVEVDIIVCIMATDEEAALSAREREILSFAVGPPRLNVHIAPLLTTILVGRWRPAILSAEIIPPTIAG